MLSFLQRGSAPALGRNLGCLAPRINAGHAFPRALPCMLQAPRHKATKTTSYRTPARAGNTTRRFPNRPFIGLRATSAEYVESGRIVVKQRKYIPKNMAVTRRRHFKYYPGENIRVTKNTSLVAMVSGRIKYTHDVIRDVLVANVLPEPREELIPEEFWRYRTEHVETMEENKHVIQLRQKANVVFGKPLLNPPTGVRPAPKRVSKNMDHWNNPTVQDPLEFVRRPYPLSGNLLRRYLAGNLDDEEAVPQAGGLSAQR
eukprot:GEMP01088400.1.p1 GENE.GEMP01088400.1~~GEMP01088400.1.p1  ORF type:complete len:258 (+),score=53.88 GEMP01088400.1:89-862(+)